MTMAGKRVLVTGGAGGLGAAVAATCVREGAEVLIADVRTELARSLAAELGPRATAMRLDVTEEADWDQVTGPLTTLVTAAGIAARARIEDTDIAVARRLLDINVVGTLLGLRTAARLMRGSGGSVITFSSVNGVIGTTGLGAYAASKFAVRGLTRVAALELAPLGIRVNSVCPGSIDTSITDGPDFAGTDWTAYTRTIPALRRGRADEVAAAVLYLAGDASAYVTGTDLIIDGGIAAGRVIPEAG